MNIKPINPSHSMDKLPARAVLGLDDPARNDWSRLRSLQYPKLAEGAIFRWLSQLVAAAMVVYVLRDEQYWPFLGMWAICLMVSLVNGAKFHASFADAERRSISAAEFRRQGYVAATAGLIWALPSLALSLGGTPEDLLTLWAVIAVLIVGAVLISAAGPLGAIIFVSIIGFAAAISFAFTGQFLMVAVAVFIIVIAAAGTIMNARTFLEARIAEAALVEKSEVVSLLLREFEENQADWLWQIDPSRRVRLASPRFAFALGKTSEEVNGKSFLELISGEMWESGNFTSSLHDLVEHLKRKESFSNLLVEVVIDGVSRWWELSGTPILDDNGRHIGFRGVGSDVTEQRESSEKIAYLARYDTLTGLPNRLMLNEGLDEGMRYADQWRSRCAFLMIDLDRFKAVNDSLGHLVGDLLLAEVSKRLKSLMGNNEMVGRLGGDEFAIVIRDASENDYVGTIARKVIEALSQPYKIDHHTLYIGASVGSAYGPRDGASVEELMRNADLALYRAKDEGGGEHFQYEPSMHASAEERRKLEFSLRHAIEHDELLLNFQPVVDAFSEQVVSFEALVRWDSSEHGLVRPDKFIPLAEDTRLIVPIGQWVLEKACIEAVNWPSHIKIAVNVSGEQLIAPEFASTVVRALAKSGLEASRLEIEVTESIFLRDADLARVALEEIMALGCDVALDDFGTGYSSLGYLRQLRFSTIKVDRSFVQGAASQHPESLAIIRAVVAMADSLEMSTTAEGVETPEEADLIRQLGCKKIQGYYFGRPMPASEAREVCNRANRFLGQA